MNQLVILPIIIPLITAVCVFFAWHQLTIQRWLNLIGNSILIIASCVLLKNTLAQHYVVSQMGNWPAPFGITLIADVLSSTLLLVMSFIVFCVSIYSFADIEKPSGKAGFYPAYNILIMGLSGAFLTGDLFNLYVWFEVILISSFVLLSLNANKNQLEGAVKYAVLNLIATLILLTAIAFLYGVTGTLNMADLAIQISHSHYQGLITTIAVIFIVAFGMKAAIFPLFFWLPASYHTPAFSTSAVFAGLLSKVGVYALLRVFTLLFSTHYNYLHQLLLALALLTLIVGILGAIAQKEMRRILSFSLISHIGYMLLGLALFTPLALIGSIFYLIQHMLVMTLLFLHSGIIQYATGTTSLRKTGGLGLYRNYPYFSILFFIAAFSLAGIPPLSGFWGKIILLKATIDAHAYLTAFVIVLVGLLTIFVMARLWQRLFLRDPTLPLPQRIITRKAYFCLLFPSLLMTLVILMIGLMPEPVYHIASLISEQLLHPEGYIHAVLGVKGP